MANGLENFSCMPRSPVCDGEEVVCSCTADCGETMHWWNGDVYFCTATAVNFSSNTNIPGFEPPVLLEVTNDCSSGTFTSRLSFNASLDVTNNTDTRIGCFVSIHEGGHVFNGNCTPIREPLGPERNYNTTLSVTNCTGMEKPIFPVIIHLHSLVPDARKLTSLPFQTPGNKATLYRDLLFIGMGEHCWKS